MSKTKDCFEEDKLLLYPDNYSGKFNRLSEFQCETPIVKGVVNQLRRWPSDIYFAFLAACFIIATLVFLVVVTVAVCLPTTIDNRWRTLRNLEVEDTLNVYFLKLENQTWSTREFCYIESAARSHPELNVYLLNVLGKEPVESHVNNQSEDKLNLGSRLMNSNSNTRRSKLTPEEQLRIQLVSGNSNIRNINVSIERLFKGSMLSKTVKNLHGEMLEMASKAQLLWSSPGIVLNPNMYCNVETIKNILCKGNTRNCVPDNMATIEPKNNIQATAVPCQAFMGYLIHEISNNKLTQKYTIKQAVDEYCPRLYYCPQVRIVDLNSECPTEELTCPTVYSSIIFQGELNIANSLPRR